ncbi:hypothetical protein [Streptomyces anulatus]|uniref:hypothetical protein n=1 Tax=Streptomyces anulatus TaxID=1892 RepID=UPI00224C912D|nr:hypothetical protein [Streptomyces anulatus]MCX4504306.1 hypothetical protein [Streptomyces anulatus]
MAAKEIPEVSPELAAARYLARQEVALQNPSTAETRTEPDTAPTQGDDTSATTR